MTGRAGGARRAGVPVLALVLLAAVSGCGLSLQALPMGASAQGPSYRVTAEVERADRLKLGGEVRLGQQVVGRVQELATDGRTARVGLSLSDSVSVPANVVVNVELPSALGDPFIRLTVPGTPSPRRLEQGSVVPLSQSRLGPDLESSLAALGMVLNGSGLDQLRTVMSELDTALGGGGADVKALTQRLNHTLGLARTHQDDLNRALVAANTVAAQLAAHQDVLTRGLDAAGPVVALLLAQRDKIVALVDSTSGLASQADRLLTATSTELGRGVRQTAQVLSSVQGFNTDVGPALANMNLFLSRFSTAVRGDYLVFDGALDVPATLEMLVLGDQAPPVSTPRDLTALLRGGAR